MSNLPKHIQEAATPLTDKLEFEQECNFDVSWEDHARNLERLTIWQQELLKEGIQYVHIDGNQPAQEYLQRYNQLQSYLKTLKGEKDDAKRI